MIPPIEVSSLRLQLSQWRDADLPVFAQLNADPVAMRYFPRCLSRSESDALAQRCRRGVDERGWGLWAVRERDSEDFVGMVGLQSLNAALPFAPGVEIVWRLHRRYWGRGYASEAANLVLEAAFEGLQLKELVAFSARANQPSRALMARLGMYDTLRNFLHPALSHDHPLAEHVLYMLSARDWRLASRGDG